MNSVVKCSLLLLAHVARPAFGLWGSQGHKVVSILTEKMLSSGTLEKIEHTLGGEDLVMISSWADEVRYSPKYEWSSRLHYISINSDPPNHCSFDMKRDCPDGFCVVGAITNYTTQLQSPESTPETLNDAVRFLVHFVEDYHNPVHATGVPIGGNQYTVYFYGKKSNMHTVWDTDIIQRRVEELGTLDKFVEEIMMKTDTEWNDERQKWTYCQGKDSALCPEDWGPAIEQLSCSVVFRNVTEYMDLTESYYQSTYPVIEKQLSMAAYRLTALLKESFE